MRVLRLFIAPLACFAMIVSLLALPAEAQQPDEQVDSEELSTGPQIGELEIDGVAFPGEPVDLTVEFSDGVAPFEVVVDWGDGSSCSSVPDCLIDAMSDEMPRIVDANHTYAEAGEYEITVTLSDATGAEAVASKSTLACSIVGTNGRDSLYGTPGDDVICGLGGNDRIFGLDGNDTIVAGSGRDRVDGGDGDDTIFGGREIDQIFGRAGADDIRAGAGNDVVRGGTGDDKILGRLGNDRIFGEGGEDMLIGNRGNDNIDGGADDDTVLGRRGNDRLNGRDGDDVMSGGQGRDSLNGSRGEDELNGGTGTDSLVGGLDDDVLDGGAGVDLANGGPGIDVCTAERVTACEADGGATEIEVQVTAPDGVAVNVELIGSEGDYLVAKPENGVEESAVVQVVPGTYLVNAPPVIVDGFSYVPTASDEAVEASPGTRSTVIVEFAQAAGANRLYVQDIGATTVDLSWQASEEPVSSYALRRTDGDQPADSPEDGTSVPVAGLTATDTGLNEGTEYTYSLFSMLEDGQIVGPHWITLGTRAVDADGSEVEYVKAGNALFAEQSQIALVVLLGDSIQVTFTGDTPLPTLGAGVVLPRSEALPGGYVGEVASVETDSNTVVLTPAGVSLVVDYYDLSVPSIADAHAGGIASASSNGRQTDSVSTQANTLLECLQAEVGAQVVEVDPTLDPDGSFDFNIDKKGIWLIGDVPVGASVDLSVSLAFGATVRAELSGAAVCTAGLDPIFTQIGSVGPVPIAMELAPKIELKATGAIEVSNIGFQAVVGFEADASLSLTNGNSFSGGPFKEGMLLNPDVTGWSGEVELNVGGSLTIGPGTGNPQSAGVIAGVNGTLFPLDASLKLSDSDDSDICLEAVAGMSGSLGFFAKAWFWKLDVEASWPLLEGNLLTYLGPGVYPPGCDEPGEVDDSVYGPGIEPIDDDTSGGPEQVGYVDGFVPGERTWVLSTGRISEAVGLPSFFASTELGYDGDPALSEASGFETFDAVRFSATVVPSGSTLNVRYVFASEEYPEYVGSQFNDAMEVRVGGQLCSNVPGTDLPVSVNTINQDSFSQYFVDNQNGASGYGTTMDGLTVPLTCSVGVTPGQEVLVTIAVADASDAVYDSAVALIDGGIWSE